MRALQSMGSTRIFELGGNEGARQRAAAPCALCPTPADAKENCCYRTFN